MKKIFFPVGLLLVVVFIVWLFILKSADNTKNENISHIAVHDVVELKFAHHMPKESILNRAAERFATQIEQKTEGKVKIKIYPNQELGNTNQMIELSRDGNIDILFTATARLCSLVPSMNYTDLPFLFPTQDDAYALFDGKVGEMLLRDLGSIDLLGVTFWDGGYKEITSNKAIEKLEDFKDLKVRVMNSRLIMEQYIALGAKPITIDFHETKQAIKDLAVDAQENPLSEIVDMEFYKVQSNMTLSEHSYLPHVLTFSKKSISKLPFDIQNILFQIAKEVTKWEREQSRAENEVLLDVIKNAGVAVNTLSEVEKARMKEATSYIMKKYEENIGSHIISKTEEYFYNKYQKNDDVVVIGIDADLSMGAKGAGLAIKRGVEIAVDELNSAGGLLGKKIAVIAKDHQGITSQANENIEEFIDDNKTIAVLGGKHSAIISSYMKKIQDNKLIYFSPWAAAPSVTDNGYEDNYVFRVSLNDKHATKFLTKEALKKSSNPAVVIENSSWGREALENINLYFESHGLQRQAGLIVNRAESDFTKLLDTLKISNHDSVIMVLNSQEAQRFIEQMYKSSLFIPIVSHWGMVGDEFFAVNKEYLKKIDLTFIQTFSFAKNFNDRAKYLAKHYLHLFSKSSINEINAPTGLAQAYDATMLIATAIKNANSFDSTDIKNSLQNIYLYEGVLKTYKKPFSQTNHDALTIDDFFMAKFDKDGNVVPLRD